MPETTTIAAPVEEVKVEVTKDESSPTEETDAVPVKAKRNRNRRNRNKGEAGAAAEDEETKEPKEVKETKPKGKQLSKEEKTKQDLARKREKMSNQYEEFKSKRTFNSHFQEYQFAEWRKHRNNLFVTVETKVPTMPKQPLVEPDDANYHLEVSKLDEQIEALQGNF